MLRADLKCVFRKCLLRNTQDINQLLPIIILFVPAVIILYRPKKMKIFNLGHIQNLCVISTDVLRAALDF